MRINIYYAVFHFSFFCKLAKFSEALKSREKENTILLNADDYKFSKFIKKINVTENHKSGVYVDQSLQIAESRYANGMCPVYNKIIMSPGNNYLNYMINSVNKGFQYPDESVTPKFKKTLADCAKTIYETRFNSNGVVGLPFTGIYNMKNQQCYLIAGSYQFVNDSSTCTLDVNQINTPKCIYPVKYINDYVFLSHNIRNDYKDKCPEKCNDNTEFGKLENGQCLKLNSEKSTTTESATDCAIFLFDNSPNEGVMKSNVGGANFHGGEQKLTYGVGYNWGNYYEESNMCVLYNESPSCINFKKNVKAFVSTAKVNGNDCEPFPESITYGCLIKDLSKCGKGTQKIYSCDKGLCELTTKECLIKCDDTGFNIWYVMGPLLGIICLALIIGLVWMFKRGSKKPKYISHKEGIFFQAAKEKTNISEDYLEEPDESFWEALHDGTHVILDKDY